MRASVFIATTTDGFIARKDGGLDWLTGADPGDEDYGFEAFMASVDALVMGRNTFDFVMTTGEWAYGETPVLVLTNRRLELLPGFPGRVEPLGLSPEAVAGELDRRGIEHVYVDGGETIRSFLRAGLVRRMIVTRLPVLIGTGIPLFGDLDADVDLRLVRSTAYENSWVQLEYEVI
ncbi:MAG: dihydrofolate reductase family protein [Acidimicrobiia bacterium]|nr:dihydrofolate reductase family protein [Acidimicrobiia bacterium]